MISFQENQEQAVEEESEEKYDYMNEEPLEEKSYEEQENDYCD